MSGSAYSPWALVQEPVRAAVRVASRLNCTVPADLARDHEHIVDCLRDAPLDALLDAAADLPAPDYISVFGPSVDGVVIKRDLVKEFLSASKKALSGDGGKEAVSDGSSAAWWLGLEACCFLLRACEDKGLTRVPFYAHSTRTGQARTRGRRA